MQLKKIIPVLVLGLVMALSFQNCAKTGIEIGDSFKAVAPSSVELAQSTPASEEPASESISDNTSDTVLGEVSDDTSDVIYSEVPGDNDTRNYPEESSQPVVAPVITVESLVATCDGMRKASKVSYQKSEVTFEDPGKACEWRADGNLSMKDAYVRGRIEQYKQLSLPQGATVCHVKLVNLDEQNFRYDDNIILTLNNYILASTTNFTQNFASTNGFYLYDWNRLVNRVAQNLKYDTTASRQYCAGASSGLSQCLFPETQTVGRVQLDFNELIIENILGMTSPNSLTLGMITTGDNDTTDCQHVPLRFAIEVEYY